jgi:hypothetical protein
MKIKTRGRRSGRGFVDPAVPRQNRGQAKYVSSKLRSRRPQIVRGRLAAAAVSDDLE